MIDIKSAREWDAELQTHIVDWDGFENRDPSVVMPREEFERRAMHSTRMIRSPELPPEDEGTTEGARESLFAWLNPIRQRIGAVTQGPPEVSPAARETARLEYEHARMKEYTPSANTRRPGYFVQRAIDAAVAEQSRHFNSLLAAMSEEAQRCRNESAAEIACLTKEAEASLAAQQKKHESHLEVVDRQWKSLCDIEAIRLEQAERGLLLLDEDRSRLRPKIDSLRAQLASATAEMCSLRTELDCTLEEAK